MMSKTPSPWNPIPRLCDTQSARGSYTTQSSSNNKYSPHSPCQICGRTDHSAINCYHRMDHTYEGRVPTKKLTDMVASTCHRQDDLIWFTDSGVLNHITSDLANLSIHNEYHGFDQVAVGNGSCLMISNIGSTALKHNSSNFHLSNILHCPDVSANLLSVNKFSQDNNYCFVFTSNGFCVKDLKTGKMLFQGKNENGVYSIHLHSNKSSPPFAFIGGRVNIAVWHQRLEHPAFPILKQLAVQSCLPFHGSLNEQEFCDSCLLEKSTRLPFQRSSSISSSPLELVQSDIWTSPYYSIKGSKYYIVFVDDYSRYSWIYPMRFKHEAFDYFVKFKLLVENLLSCSIKSL